MAENIFAGAEGIRLVADRFGESGPAVLLLHGGGQTRHAWQGAAKRLAGKGFCAIALDQRGHGDSAWHEAGHYAFADFAADLAAVAETVRAEEGRKPFVVGASLGGIAAMLAAAEGDEPPFAGLVLVDVTPRLKPEGVSRIKGFMRERSGKGFATVEEAAEAVARYLPHRKRPKSLTGLKKNLRLREDGRYHWHWDPRFLEGPRPVDAHAVEERLKEALRRLAIPILLVRGARSELVETEHVEEFLSLAPHAQVVDVSEAGHMVAGDRNDVFAGAVLGFLTRLAPPAQAGEKTADASALAEEVARAT
ncbi:alpha/beta fold hydrolase [Afifella pfennigii]|uniref:alpha/beta fold hydrolase n=1 Tax=Afifella pfennigii TaxID=209897 RepID=UPI0006905845|nr:alpha/beta hydrolase [Afifella pfennigii]